MGSSIFQRIVEQIAVSPGRLRVVLSREELLDELVRTMKKIQPCNGPAQTGDFVLCEVRLGDEWSEKSVCLGNARVPGLDEALLGHLAGEEFPAVYFGQAVRIRVRGVKRPESFDVERDDFSTLGISGVHTRDDYIRWSIDRKRDDARNEQAAQLLPGVEGQYVRLALAECPEREALERGMNGLLSHAVEDQKEMLIAYTGSEDAYQQVMEETYRRGTVEANERAYQAAELALYRLGMAAGPVMREIGFDVTQSEYDANVTAYAASMNLSEERYRQLCGFREFQLSAWAQKLRQMLFQAFLERIEVVAE